MRAIAKWCVGHRTVVIGIWILLAIGAHFAESATGSNYSASTQLNGTPSVEAANLLAKAAPGLSGDSESVVFQSTAGSVTAPAVKREINSMLRQVSGLPHVVQVSSPYAKGGSQQISTSGRIAFATVDFNESGDNVSNAEATKFVHTVRAPKSQTLKIDVVGDVSGKTVPSSSTGVIVGIGAALIVLGLVFGSFIAALIPMITTGIALLTALSIVGMLSKVLGMADFTSELCTLIGLGVGIDYALFILTRTRTGIRRGLTVDEAVQTAAATAGRAVLFAGITVCIALLGMLTVGVSVLNGAAVAASISVLLPMLAALTLLPAVIGAVGKRVLTRPQRTALRAEEYDFQEASPRWLAWSRLVEKNRVIFAILSLAVLCTLAIPVFSMRGGIDDFSTDPTSTNTTVHRAYERLAQGFGPGFNGPLDIVATLNHSTDAATFTRTVNAIDHTAGVASVTTPTIVPATAEHPAIAFAEAYPTGSPESASTAKLITTLRSSVIPDSLHGAGLQVLVGGKTALGSDFSAQLTSKLPLFIGFVVLLSFLLLMVVFRSVAIPLTAAIMNLLSAGASFGVITAIFQWGWLDSLIGVHSTGPIQALAPILMFPVLFGLSMDYEVFLISRIQEEWVRRKDNSAAVNFGQATSGRTITAAASIMVVVFAAFVDTTDHTIKLIGLGMAVAVALDALIIRTMLVPAIMHWLGKRNWDLPDSLERRLPRINIEGARKRQPGPVKDLISATR